MKLSREELIYKSNLVNTLLTKEDLESTTQSKLKYAVQKHNVKIKSIIEKHNSEIEEINIRLASEDEKGNLVVSEKGQYSYTKANEQKRRNEIKDLASKTEDFEPYLFLDKDKIDTFDPFIKEELAGFFFDIPSGLEE